MSDSLLANVTVEIAPVHHTVEKQLQLVQSAFAAVIRYRDPDSQGPYTSVSMVVPSRGWRVRYWARNRGPTGTTDYTIGIVIDLPKEDFADVEPYVHRLGRSLGGDVVSVVESHT